MGNKMLTLPFDDQNQSTTIVKSNFFINGQYKFSLTQAKVLLCICMQIRKEDPIDRTYSVKIKEIIGNVSGGANYRQIEAEADKLLDIKINLPTVKPGAFEKTHLLSYVNYPADDSGMIHFRFDVSMRKHFLSLKEAYTKYSLQYVWLFKSSHSIRIYELLKEYACKGHHYRQFELSSLKERLGIENSYSEFYELKRRVIIPAQKEINKHSDITFDYTPMKVGRKVTGIMFLIKEKSKQTIKETIKPTKLPEVKQLEIGEEPVPVKVIPKSEISKNEINEVTYQKLSKQYDLPYLNFVIEKVKERKPTNLTAYVHAVIGKESMRELFDQQNTKKEKKEKKKVEKLQVEQLKIKKREAEEAYEKYYANQKLEFYQKFDSEVNRKLFESYLIENKAFAPLRYLDRFKKNGMRDKVIKNLYGGFLLRNNDTENIVLNFQDFGIKYYQLDFQK